MSLRFSIAQRSIVPAQPMPMNGYARRTVPFEAVNDALLCTTLVLESGRRRIVICAADLLEFPHGPALQELRRRLCRICGCTPADIVLNASHTHGAPLLPSRWLSFDQQVARDLRVHAYVELLIDRVAESAVSAMESLDEGTLWYAEGKTGLPINRRLERDGTIHLAPDPHGPVDDRFQLLVLKNRSDVTRAVAMRLSCHPVATGAQLRLTADWVGAWRQAIIEALGPQVTPLFLQGAAGDQRPRATARGDEWRTLDYDELPALGRTVMADTMAALSSGLVPIEPPYDLKGHLREVIVPCEPRFTRAEQFEPLLSSGEESDRIYARYCLDRLSRGESIERGPTFQVQTIWLNERFTLVGLDVEPLVRLGRKIAAAFSPRTAIVLGYTNGCVCYAPDSIELARGGYEAENYRYLGWSGPWTCGFEKAVLPSLVLDPAVAPLAPSLL